VKFHQSKGIETNFFYVFVIKAQIKIGGRVSIPIIGPLASSPIPIPAKKDTPNKC